MPLPVLRPYQNDLAAGVQSAWAQGAQNVLMRLDTGGGKSVILSSIVLHHTGASAIIAHRNELVLQLSAALARNGVRHNVIAAKETIAGICKDHIEKFGRVYYDPGAPCTVASVDTLVRRKDIAAWCAQVTLWVVDECFPAGTLVDGRPIETLKTGDVVTGFDEVTGAFSPRKVLRVFKNKAPDYMVRISSCAHHVVHCTLGHPIWTKRGWVAAGELNDRDELLYMQSPRDYDAESNGRFQALRPGILQPRMQQSLRIADIVADYGAHKSQVRFGSNGIQQSDEPPRRERKGARVFTSDGASAKNKGRQWPRPDASRNNAFYAFRRPGVRSTMRGSYQNAEGKRVSDLLQIGLRESDTENRHRSGRKFPQFNRSSNSRRKEGCFSQWTRVESVEIYERSNPDRPRDCGDDGFVYNIEVEGVHTYTANGLTVHNCHHLVEDNKWHRAIALFTHPQCRGLGPTATPARADGKGLGRHADGFFDVMIEGPPMRWLIEQGYLSEYKLICPPGDLEMIEEVGASGDWSTVQLRKAAKKSHIVGNVVDAYLKYGAGKLGITFATDVETAGEMTLAYRAKGVRAETLTGETDSTWRRNMLKMYEARQLDQIVAVDIVSEGFDLPAIEVCSLARPTASLPLYMQQFGRALRILPGKEYALIIDHVGNTVRHGGAPDKPRPWTLDRRDKKSRGATTGGVRVCVGTREAPGCLQPYERFRTECPYCGTPVPEPAGRSSPAQVDGDLVMLDADALAILRGQVEQVDMPPSTYGLQLIAAGVPGIGATANQKRHAAKQEAQATLREAMGFYGGALMARGFSDREMQRQFYLTFGVDVLSAQALGVDDAAALETKIRGAL